MSSFSSLKTAIQNAIKANGNQEITGNLLQGILLSIVETMGDSAINTLETGLSNEATTRGNADTQINNLITGIKNNIDNGYVYAGIATPSTTPASGKVFYIALQSGTYTNFGNTAVTQGINILKYNGSAWSKDVVIVIDDTPTQGSNNLVKSGGVYNQTNSIKEIAGVILLSLSNVEYFDGSGVHDSTIFASSDFIAVNEGDLIYAYTRSYNNIYAISMFSSNSNASLVSAKCVAGQGNGNDLYSCTIPSGIAYIKVTADIRYFSIAAITKNDRISLNKANIEKLNSDILALAKINNNTILSLPNGKYYNNSGANNSERYKSTDFIAVNEGDELLVYTRFYDSMFAISMFSSQDDSSLIIADSILGQGVGNDIYKTTIPSGVSYIKVSADTNIIQKVSYAINGWQKKNDYSYEISKVASLMSFNKVELNHFGYVQGTSIGSSTAFKYTDYIPVQGLTNIACLIGNVKTILAVAFYSEKDDLSSYIRGAYSNGNENDFLNVEVPENANYAILCVDTRIHQDNGVYVKGNLVQKKYSYTGCLINIDGSAVENVRFMATDFIPVAKGDVILVDSYNYQAQLAISAYSGASQSDVLLYSAYTINGVGRLKKYLLEIEEDNVKYIRVNFDSQYYTPDGGKVTLTFLNKEKPFNIELKNNILTNINVAKKRGMVCFQMDCSVDAFYNNDNYKDYIKLLKEYGINCSTFGILPENFSRQYVKTAAKWLKEHGQEICIHSDSTRDNYSSDYNLCVQAYYQEFAEQGIMVDGWISLTDNDPDGLRVAASQQVSWGTLKRNVTSNHNVTNSDYMDAVNNAQTLPTEVQRCTGESRSEYTQEFEDLIVERMQTLIDYCVENKAFIIFFNHSYENYMDGTPYTLHRSALLRILNYMKPYMEKGLLVSGGTTECLNYYYANNN